MTLATITPVIGITLIITGFTLVFLIAAFCIACKIALDAYSRWYNEHLR